MQKTNSIIKFDLHIHSSASAYKEDSAIISNSNKENITLLLSKLNEHKVALFSITDHNRFDVELYKAIITELTKPNNPYSNVKTVLAGVEFDVKLDDDFDKCHIIAIFDTKYDEEKLKRVDAGLNNVGLLENKNDYYTKDKFEEVLRQIGLDTILIASQHKDIHNHSKGGCDLSDATDNIEEIIKIGYIDALEFQKPKVEGILINSLKTLDITCPLVSGSDCHDWNCYPDHDASQHKKEFHHSKAKILPTFKGLLMAVSSPETRFGCHHNTNEYYLDMIKLNDQKIILVNGINAIIGENGAGKTTLLKLLTGHTNASHIKKLISDNSMDAGSIVPEEKIKYIEQGEIIKKFYEGTLFSTGEEDLEEIDTSSFVKNYSSFAQNLYRTIMTSIKRKQVIDGLNKKAIAFNDNMKENSYFINILCPKGFSSIDNLYSEARQEIAELIKKIKSIKNKKCFQDYDNRLNTVLDELSAIQLDIEEKWRVIDSESKIKNIICSCINEYNRKIKSRSTDRDLEMVAYKKQKQDFVDSIVDAIKESVIKLEWPCAPEAISGATKKSKQGFYFNKETAYNGVSMAEKFLAKMFIKKYRNFAELEKIETQSEFQEAIMNCTALADIESKWKENFQKFIDEATKTKEYITDGTNQQIGNTLGEMSLSYYQYFTQDSEKWSVFIVDQPEDNISNNNISQKLLSYFQAIRYEKQLVFVTHNPLLVVNLDVDNVIYLENNNGILSACDGCLEYEDEDNNILELIAQNMDGGKEAIEKRLRIYGKNH